MRNLKRALSLALASVMLLGMMVVGTSAASYTDVDENDNVEAIEVLNAVDVMIGRQGNFEPDEPVNRHEMAVIMAKLVLGVETADNYVGSHPYTDVVPWADKYVAACYENGLTSGTSATTYGGGQPLKAVEAAAMMLRALGYKDLSKGADDWRAPVTATANQIRLFQGVASNPSEQLNRNQVAQLALNTLKSPMVNLIDGTFDISNGEGQIIITGGSREYKVIASRESYAYAINNVESSGNSASGINGATVELGEHLYNGKLRLNNLDMDVFDRPARTWEYDGKTIGTYVKGELLRRSYSVKVTGKDLYELLTKNTIDTYRFVISIDGVATTDANAQALLGTSVWFDTSAMIRSNTDAVGGTGKGVTTEVYVDTQNEIAYISIINTYLAKANADYNSKTEKVSVSVYWGMNNKGNTDPSDDENVSTPKTLELADFPQISSVKEGDFMLVNWADPNAAPSRKGIVKVMDVEVLSDRTVTKFSQSSNLVTKVTVDGTEYKGAAQLFYDVGTLNVYDGTLLTNKTYDVYLDQFGNAIGVDLHSGDDNYVFITGFNMNSSDIAITNATANAIFLDGSMRNIEVNVKDTNDNIDAYNSGEVANDRYPKWTTSYDKPNPSKMNTWYKYSLDEANKVYTLTPVAVNHQFATSTNTEVDINSKNIRLDGNNVKVAVNHGNLRGFGNENSVYITVGVDTINSRPNVITEVTGVYTNVQTVDITSPANTNTQGVFALTDGKEFVIGAIVIGEDNGSNANYTYIFSDAKSEWKTGDTYYWNVDAVVEGEVKELTIKTKYTSVITEIKKNLVSTVTDSDLNKAFANGYLFRLSYDADGYVVNAKAFNNATSNIIHTHGSTGWNTAIDDQIIRWSNISATNGEELTMKGISLYNKDRIATADGKDVGLPIAPDAKFIVAQNEYNNFEKTEYATINEALDAIADANDATEAVDFKGTICAVLDGQGRAKWIVFDNLVGLDSDQNEGDSGVLQLDGLSFNGSYAGIGYPTQITYTNNTGASLTYTSMSVEIRTEDGTLVCRETRTTGSTTVNNGATATLDFKYKGTNTAPAKYQVTVTVTDGTNTYTGSATIMSN